MSVFTECFALLLGNEGGYSNNPKDPGGETMWGVTKRVAQKHGYSGSMKALPKETAENIAYEEYWAPFHCDMFPKAIAFQVLDTAYNGGHPIQWLQGASGVVVNGKYTDELVTAVKQLDTWEVVALFNAQRLRYLASLGQAAFANGRMNRIAGNLEKGSL